MDRLCPQPVDAAVERIAAPTDPYGDDLQPGLWLDIDETCQVGGIAGGWLDAAGDVYARSLLTHLGQYQARACGDGIAALAAGTEVDTAAWGRHVATADRLAEPQVVFTNPQIAAVGRTEAQAPQAGLRAPTVDHDLGAVAGASFMWTAAGGKPGLSSTTAAR